MIHAGVDKLRQNVGCLGALVPYVLPRIIINIGFPLISLPRFQLRDFRTKIVGVGIRIQIIPSLPPPQVARTDNALLTPIFIGRTAEIFAVGVISLRVGDINQRILDNDDITRFDLVLVFHLQLDVTRCIVRRHGTAHADMSREDRIRFGCNILGTERTFYSELIDEPRFFDRNLHLRRRGEFDRRRVVGHVVHLQRIGIDHQVVRTGGFAPDRDRLFLPLLDRKFDRAQFDRLRRIDRTFGIHLDRYFVIAVAFEPFDRRTADRNLIVAI